jgi:hypothetical protein
MTATGIERRMREHEELCAEYEAIGAYAQRALTEEFRNFLAGARAAISWVLGQTVQTPASGQIQPASAENMHAEERYCDSVIYSDHPYPAVDRDYANGVEHALSWARGTEDVPPAPLEAVMATPRLCACG